MAPRPYYTVIEKLAGAREWTPQYGSYDKEDCRQEVECYASICTNPLHSWKLISSGDTQAEINQAVQAVNRAV
jgi:hypothetical protein